MNGEMSSFLTELSNSINGYMKLGQQNAAEQQKAQRQADLELENQKKLKIFDMQIGDLRDASKFDRETVPVSIFQGKGIDEADGLPGDTRIKIDDAFKYFKEQPANKKIANASSINQLRGDYLTQSKSFATVGESMQRIIDSAQDPSAAGDLSMIFSYMKLLDPSSVVREGEFATAQNAGSVPQSIQAQYNKVLNGERLAPTLRNDFVGRSIKLYRGQENLQRQRKASFSNLAMKQGIDPDTVTFNMPTPPSFDTEAEAAKATGLKPGSYVIIGDRLARVK